MRVTEIDALGFGVYSGMLNVGYFPLRVKMARHPNDLSFRAAITVFPSRNNCHPESR